MERYGVGWRGDTGSSDTVCATAPTQFSLPHGARLSSANQPGRRQYLVGSKGTANRCPNIYRASTVVNGPSGSDMRTAGVLALATTYAAASLVIGVFYPD